MVKDTVMMSGIEPKLKSVKVDGGGGDVESVKCECCRLTEECTQTYIATVRESNHGRWICGLCTEAVKEEMERSCSESEEEALDRHMRFCKNFRSSMSSPPLNPTEDLISAVKQLLIRSLDSPRSSSSVESENSNYHHRLSSPSSSSLVRSNGCHFSIDN
ncbi:hypothetical protein L6452_27127 [Arctium lappa]|uniref:Uncharacterized protein n=1 Tax=Arctium lappa TaxID=4217 RepID=A0ACB9A064_ARCLA|nr:hypothetical protein L6452_27127 [Arctium lappa]